MSVNAQTTVNSSTNGSALENGQEGRTFFSNGRYWIFYYDSNNYTFTSSTDGTNWATKTNITTSGDVYAQTAGFYVNGTTIYYAIEGAAPSSRLIYTRNGTLNAAGTITWNAETSFTMTNNASFTPYTTIATDSLGNLWVAFIDNSSYLEDWHYSSSTWTRDLYVNTQSSGAYSLVPLNGGQMALISGSAAYTDIRTISGVAGSWTTAYQSSTQLAPVHNGATAIGNTVEAVGSNSTGVYYMTYVYGSGVWSTPTLIFASGAVQCASITSDENYKLIISYFSSTSTLLYNESANSGASWATSGSISTTETLTVGTSMNFAVSEFLVSNNMSLVWISGTGPYQLRFNNITDSNSMSSVSVTFTSSPTGSGYITVNGTAETTPYTIASANVGDTYTIAANSPANIVVGQSQYLYSSWNDSGSQSHTITVSTATTYTASFQLQYYLTVTGGNSPSGQGWYNSGSGATPTNAWIWSTSGSTRSALTNWQLDTVNQNPSRSNTGTFTTSSITMNAPHTANFVSTTQYYLTVSGGNGTTFGTASPTSDQWYDTGTNTTISSNWVWDITPSQSRYSITNYAIDGSNQNPARLYTGTLTTSSVTMSTYHTIAFASTTQYNFVVSSTYNSPTGNGYYDNGSTVSSNIVPNSNTGSGIGYEVSSWTGTGSLSSGGTLGSSTTGSFTITAYSTCVWNWLNISTSISQNSYGVPYDNSTAPNNGFGMTIQALTQPNYVGYQYWLCDDYLTNGLWIQYGYALFAYNSAPTVEWCVANLTAPIIYYYNFSTQTGTGWNGPTYLTTGYYYNFQVTFNQTAINFYLNGTLELTLTPSMINSTGRFQSFSDFTEPNSDTFNYDNLLVEGYPTQYNLNVSVPIAYEVLQNGVWHIPNSLVGGSSSCGLGIQGHLQNSALPDGALIIGGSVAQGEDSFLCWSGNYTDFPVASATSIPSTTTTLYFRSDITNSSGSNFNLGTTQSSYPWIIEQSPNCANGTDEFWVQILHADGSTTNITNGYTISISGIGNITSAGYYTVNWNCPQTAVLTTDRLLITMFMFGTYNGAPQLDLAYEANATFVSNPLQATTISGNWSFNIYVISYTVPSYTENNYLTFGSPTYNSDISGIQLTGTISYIVISPSTAALTSGQTQNYTASAYDQYNNLIGDVSNLASWSINSGAGGSWANNVYTGQFSNQGGTPFTVTASYQGINGTAQLTVTQPYTGTNPGTENLNFPTPTPASTANPIIRPIVLPKLPTKISPLTIAVVVIAIIVIMFALAQNSITKDKRTIRKKLHPQAWESPLRER